MDSIKKNSCRLCQNTKLEKVFSLGKTALANSYRQKDVVNNPIRKFNLDLYFCKNCFHLQLIDVVNPKLLFDNYLYVSGTSKVFVDHFEDYAIYIKKELKQKEKSLIVDIGSNDGTFLKSLKSLGFLVLGCEPAKNLSLITKNAGIESINLYFSYKTSQLIKDKKGQASIITANNVFAHIDNLSDIVLGVKNLLNDNGFFIFEVSYLVDLIKNNYFDTIYHEHLSYHSVQPLKKFLQKHQMKIVDAIRVPSHGGSIRIISTHQNNNIPINKSVENLITLEKKMFFNNIKTFVNFENSINKIGEKLNKILKNIKKQNKSIAGFGAPAKATTLMHKFKINSDLIDFIVDDNKLKQNLYMPETNIPIFPVSEIYSKKPDYILILAWNFSNSICTNHKKYIQDGGKFIIPLPKLKVIES